MSFGFFWEASLINLPNSSSSSETQGRLVGSGKMATKVSMNRWRSPWDTTVNKPVPWLIQMLVCDWAQKIRGQHLSHSNSWSSYTKECTCKLDCSLYACEKLSPVSVWLVQKNFLEKIFQRKWAPKFTLPVSFDPLVSRWGERFNNKFTNFKGRKNFFYMYLTSIPGRHKQSRRRFARTILEDSGIYEFTFDWATCWFFQLVHFSFCFVLLTC